MKSILGRLRYRRLASTFTILATLSAGILIGSIVSHGVRGQETSKVDTSDATPLKVPNPRDLSTDFTKIAKDVEPAVVNINTVTLPKERQQSRRNPHQRQFQQQQPPDDNGDDDQDDQGQGGQGQGQNNFQDFFNHFFGMGPEGAPDESGQERESLGSGFIVDPRGYIITNNHVVDKADKIFVKLPGDPDAGELQGRPATVVGVDKDTDIAVIKIQTDHPLPTVKLGNSEGAQVGDWVIAIGSPFTLSQTVTAGIVSAKNRTIDQSTAGQFQHFIQTDAAINPGNSGGPLLNMAGEVVGVNTAIFTQSGTYAGIGFAMPANTVISVYNQLISPEHKVVRGSIGITFQASMPAAVSRVYGFKSGVLVASVQPGFAADKAGLKPGDIIVTIDGKSIKDGNDLVENISVRKPGSTAQVGYVRNGKQAETTVTIGDRAKMIAAVTNGPEDEDNANPSAPDASQAKLGLQVSDLPQGAPAGLHGVVVEAIKPGSFADEIGLTGFQGNIIIAVNRQPVHNVAEFGKYVAALKSGSDVAFELVDPQHRGQGSRYVGGTLP